MTWVAMIECYGNKAKTSPAVNVKEWRLRVQFYVMRQFLILDEPTASLDVEVRSRGHART